MDNKRNMSNARRMSIYVIDDGKKIDIEVMPWSSLEPAHTASETWKGDATLQSGSVYLESLIVDESVTCIIPSGNELLSTWFTSDDDYAVLTTGESLLHLKANKGDFAYTGDLPVSHVEGTAYSVIVGSTSGENPCGVYIISWLDDEVTIRAFQIGDGEIAEFERVGVQRFSEPLLPTDDVYPLDIHTFLADNCVKDEDDAWEKLPSEKKEEEDE